MDGRAQKHAMRNLFRMDDDSSSSLSSSNEDDNNVQQQTDVPQSSSLPSSPTSSTITTMIQRIHHVELEMCSIGGSIEHRLWPAATFLTSYMLQPMVHTNNNSNKYLRHCNTNINHQQIHQNMQRILENFRCMISPPSTPYVSKQRGLRVLELGAGIGFTSLELAYHMSIKNDGNIVRNDIKFLMTDLSSALPLLQRNQQRNFGVKNSSIQVQELAWGNHGDIEKAVAWYKNTNTNTPSTPVRNSDSSEIPLLILGTDCVYWESLYDILETTIASLLQNATPNSICLLANVRRWKRDTNFFQHRLGQVTSTINGRLHCICIHEEVARHTVMSDCCIDDRGSSRCSLVGDPGNNNFGHQQEQREIIRIYAIQWIETCDK